MNRPKWNKKLEINNRIIISNTQNQLQQLQLYQKLFLQQQQHKKLFNKNIQRKNSKNTIKNKGSACNQVRNKQISPKITFIRSLVQQKQKWRQNSQLLVSCEGKQITQNAIKKGIKKAIKQALTRVNFKSNIPSLKTNLQLNTFSQNNIQDKFVCDKFFKPNKLQHQLTHKIKYRSLNKLLPKTHQFNKNNIFFHTICHEFKKQKNNQNLLFNDKIFGGQNKKKFVGQNNNSGLHQFLKNNLFTRIKKSFHQYTEQALQNPEKELNDYSICKIKQLRPMTMEVRNLKSAQNNYKIKRIKYPQNELQKKEQTKNIYKQKIFKSKMQIQPVGPWKSFDKQIEQYI